MTATIHPEYQKAFDKLEALYIDLQQKVNAFPETGDELDRRLLEVLQWFEPIRLPLMTDLGVIARSFNLDETSQHQQMTFGSELYCLIQEAPYYWQIINKPEGYVGDAEMMKIIYRHQFEGTTPFGRLVHFQAVSCEACQAVRNRRAFLREEILKLKNHGGGNILSIAAGPAMEMRDVLIQDQSEDTYHCYAFDHDIKTIRKTCLECTDPRLHYVLGNAFHIIKGSYRVAVPRKVLLGTCEPRLDFQGWRKVLAPVKYSFETLKKEDYDLVYSAGLYDYIKTFPEDHSKGTIALTRRLFDLVKPGGTLILGNFNPTNPPDIRFVMDYLCDWQLIYRTEEEMFELAQAIPEQEIASMKIEKEPLGINYFLKIEKIT